MGVPPRDRTAPLWRRYLVGNTIFLAGLARDAAVGPRPLVPTQRTGESAARSAASNPKG